MEQMAPPGRFIPLQGIAGGGGNGPGIFPYTRKHAGTVGKPSETMGRKTMGTNVHYAPCQPGC